MITAEQFNQRASGNLPGHLGIVITHLSETESHCHMPIHQSLLAPNGFLHAGAVVSLADTGAGSGCIANLPLGASGFTTIELKSNFLGTAIDGFADCVATVVHKGKTTQVWDALVTHRETGKKMALFRCTQMILYPKPA